MTAIKQSETHSFMFEAVDQEVDKAIANWPPFNSARSCGHAERGYTGRGNGYKICGGMLRRNDGAEMKNSENKKTVLFTELEGSHYLYGVDVICSEIKEGYNKGESATVCLFNLDGTVYNVTENPNDGYRSSADDCFESDEAIKNKFFPVKVICKFTDKALSNYGDGGDILQILNAKTGAIILEIGTDNIDDYYPSYICNFSAEAPPVCRAMKVIIPEQFRNCTL